MLSCMMYVLCYAHINNVVMLECGCVKLYDVCIMLCTY